MRPGRAGTVAVVGRPNAGKSTLVNALVGTKVAIVSDKPQTTRRNLLGIRNDDEGQIVFVDTPGLHKPLHRLNKSMVAEAQDALREEDVRLLVVDAAVPTGEGDRFVLELLRSAPAPRICVLNKVDLLRARRSSAGSRRSARRNLRRRGPGVRAHRRGPDVLTALRPTFPRGRAVPGGDRDDVRRRHPIAETIRESSSSGRARRSRTDSASSSRRSAAEAATDGRARDDRRGPDGHKGIVSAQAAASEGAGTAARLDLEQSIGGKFFLEPSRRRGQMARGPAICRP